MPLKRWATAKLRQGDLTALARIANKQPFGPDEGRVERLSQRGFVRRKSNDGLAATLKGRAALLIRNMTKT